MDLLPSPSLENRTFGEIAIGDCAALVHTLTQDDADLFAIASGGTSQAYHDGLWSGSLIATAIGTKLPGPGTISLSQDLHFLAPIGIGDPITTTVTVLEKSGDTHEIVLGCRCVNGAGVAVVTGSARVRAPTEKLRLLHTALPDVQLGRHHRFHALMARAGGGPPVTVAVVHPCDAASLGAAIEAADAGLITPILVGPVAQIRAVASAMPVDIGRFRLVDTSNSHAAAVEGVALVRAGEAAMVMKGALHTSELMRAVVAAKTGLRTGRRLSHVYLMDLPSYPRLLLVTDAAVNIAPSLAEKRDIVQNAIDLALVMGIDRPRVAILSAIETINPAIRSTLDAAALCKMAERGQITGGVLDGPLAFDNAISPAAASAKGIVSDVAGRADILVVPDLESGNMLAKQMAFQGGADAAGVVVGARVPIILASRAASERTRLASCAVAVLMARNAQGARDY